MADEHLTDNDLDIVQRIGRDEENRRTTISLVEFDAVVDQARLANRLRAALKEACDLAEQGWQNHPRNWQDDRIAELRKLAEGG